MSLAPSPILRTGTGALPAPRVGELVEVEIPGLGRIANEVVRAPA